MDSQNRCPSCGGKVFSDSIKCMNCGYDFKNPPSSITVKPRIFRKIKVCPSCNLDKPLEFLKCPNCGIELILKSYSSLEEEIKDRGSYKFDGGKGDYLVIHEAEVTLQHKGIVNVIAQGVKGDKTIFISDLTSIQFKKPSEYLLGYIQFSLPGAIENRMGIMGAEADENSIKIVKSKEDEAEVVSEYLLNRLRELKNPKPFIWSFNPSDEIRKFKSLLDDGIISQEEFDAKKKQLLGL
jgi:DNA-directed RNA polymerase subunit RPC12/RpoP